MNGPFLRLFFFFSFFQKVLLFSFDPGLEQGLQGEAQTEDRTPQGMMPEGPSKTSGLPSLLVTLEGEPSGETLPQPSPKSLTSSSRKWFSRKSQRWLSPRARRSRRAWFRIFPRTLAASLASRVLPPLLSRRLLYFPEKGTKPPPPPRCFCIFKGGWVISLLLANGQKWPTPCGATPSRPDRSPEKGKYRRPTNAGWPAS